MESQYEVIIIGAGVAGLTSAIYARRANLNTLVIEANMPGGKLVKIDKIENYPGFSEISGADLAMNLVNQAEKFETNIVYEAVVRVNKNNDIITVITDQNTYTTQYLIIATGTLGAKLPVKDADKFTGKGISYCAVCDGNFYKGKDVIVVGQSERAIQEALYLSKIVNKVYLVVRDDTLKVNKDLSNIEVINNSISESLIVEDDKLVGLNIKNLKDGSIKPISCSAIFPNLKESPANGFVSELKICDKFGYIKTDNNMQTEVENIYAAGDIVIKDLRQVVTAASDGAIAINSIITKMR